MEFEKVINEIVEGGIAGVKRDYKRKDQKAIREGSIAGFEACRGQNLVGLTDLLEKAEKKRNEVMLSDDHKDYWYHVGFQSEVEWVCNVISALLFNQGQPTIIPPTARGMMRAAQIVGVKETMSSKANK